MAPVVLVASFIALITLTHGTDREDLPADAEMIIDVTHKIPDEDCDIKSKNGDTLSMHYTGTLYSTGEKFDSSLDRGTPFTFPLGGGRVIKGWDQGLQDMCIGEKRTLTIPSDLGYGASGSGAAIPGGATLVFETELLDIKSSEAENSDQHVVSLTDADFDSFIKEHDRLLVEFYAPWCGHCKALAPKYDAAAGILKEKNSKTVLAKVDATENPGVASQFEIQGYPTLVFLEDGMKTAYEGGREVEDIVDWVMERDQPPYEVITHAQFESMRSDVIDLEVTPEREFEVFAFVRKGSKRDRLYHNMAREVYKEPSIKFYKIHRKKGDSDPYRVVLRRNNREKFTDEKLDGVFEATYTGRLAPTKKSLKSTFSFKDYDLGTWMQEHRNPFFIDLDAMPAPDNNENGVHPYSVLYLTPKVPRGGLILIRVPADDDPEVTDRVEVIQKLKEDLIDTVQELRANEGFMVVLTSKNHEKLGFTSDVQMMVIHKKIMKIPKLPRDFQSMYSEPNRGNPSNRFQRNQRGQEAKDTVREYRYPSSEMLSGENLKQFVRDSVDGKVTRWIRSTESMESDEGMHYAAVGAKDFETTVLDKSYDVLMLYCTKWNQYCEELMIEYNKLAKHVATYYQEKALKIAFMDCDENDVDDPRVNALPTMILYPAGTDDMLKGKLLSQEQRTVDDIVDFLDEFAVTLNKDEL